jgi:hypothetical protein
MVQRVAGAVLGATLVCVVPHAQPPAHAQLVILVDGLRPDQVTPQAMPRLAQLAQRGMVFTHHHAVFPTVTRVNAASLLTGAYPEAHGLLGNTIFLPSANATRVLDTSVRTSLELIEGTSTRILTVPTLREILSGVHRRMLAVSAGSSGLSYLLHDTLSGRAVIHTDTASSGALAPHGEDQHDAAAALSDRDARNRRAIDMYLGVGLDQVHPDVTCLWLNDPDETAHAQGLDSALTHQALAHVDAGIGRILDTLREKGLLDRTNILVLSDHGFSAHRGTLTVKTLLEHLNRSHADGSRDFMVADGAIYLRAGADHQTLATLVAALQRQPEVGAIFSRPRARGGPEGIMPGTLSYDIARWNHGRSGDLLVSANWRDATDEAGFAGQITQAGVAGHGTSSPYDIHATLIAAGPDFREHATSDVPTSTVDIAPTLLQLLGVPIPPTMSGRPLLEGLRTGTAVPMTVEHLTETVSSADGRYALTAHISVVLNHRYLDFTEVMRH